MKAISVMAENLTISPSNIVPRLSINDFPNELLRQTFLSLADTEGARSALGRVCYRWRQIVRATFEFWSTIRLREPVSVMEVDPYLWARQAGSSSQPITVVWEINWLCRDNLYYGAYVTAFRNFLQVAPYSRWRELRIGRASVNATAADHQPDQIEYYPTLRTFEELELLPTNKPPEDFSKACRRLLKSMLRKPGEF
jgi:hypothetical protein